MLNKNKLGAPWRLTFDTNPDQCNLHCIMCEEHSNYNIKKEKLNRVMDFKIIEDVLEDTIKLGLKEIIPSTMGEPLLYKNIIELLNLIKHYKLKLNLTTNGTFPRLNIEDWGQLILPIASDVKISINGASKEINDSIMEGIDFDKHIEYIKKFLEIRDNIRRQDLNHPTITLQATFMKRNIKEMPELLRLAIKLGIDRFKGHHLWITHPELDDESLRKEKIDIRRWNSIVDKMNLIIENERLRNGNKIRLENIYSIPKENENVIPDNFLCPFLGKEAWIAWDGTVNVCCSPDYLRQSLGYFGNIRDTGFMKIWNGENYMQLIDNWGNYEVCKICNMRRPLNKIRGCNDD